jgi:isopentenyldiphosphate isomerase
MTQSESVDIFNENMLHIGVASREAAHTQGLWHQTFHCWIVRRHGDDCFVLFQRRGPNKKVYPNALDITAAGHLTAQETPDQGVREVNEELGLDITSGALIPLGIRTEVAEVHGQIIREFCHTYLLHHDAPLEQYLLQADEVASIVQMRVTDGLALFGGERDSVTVTGRQLAADGSTQSITSSVVPGDVIPRLDRYYLKVFIMAERFFAGHQHLAI